MKYEVILDRSEEGVAVSVPGLPGCWSQGESEAEALDNIRWAIAEYLEVVNESSVDFVVSSDLDEEDILRFRFGVADKLEQEAQVVTGAAGPGTGQTALQFVGGELSCEGVRLQKPQGHLDVSEYMGLTFNRPAERAAKGVAPEELSHSSISAIRSSTVPR